MSLRYNLEVTKLGYYKFTTELNIEYTAFFTECSIEDSHGNIHKAFSFGFEKSGKYGLEKFSNKFDYKIKNTVIFIVKEFFKRNGNDALIYFCFQDDEYARHRSITFSKWYRDELSSEIEHHKKNGVYNKEKIYAGVLVSKQNPLRQLIIQAIDKYIHDLMINK